MVTQLALVWFFSSMAAPMHHQIALELEGLTTELTGLDLVLCLRRGGAVWWNWWQWRGVQKGRLWSRLKMVGIKESVHRVCRAG